MTELEKVIKGLETCISINEGEDCPKECPYYHDVCFGYGQLMRDALALLKEQEPQSDKGKWIILENCANAGVYCSACNTKIFEFTHRPKHKVSQFCPHCGANMDQEKIVRM